jgi:hypothetical protein
MGALVAFGGADDILAGVHTKEIAATLLTYAAIALGFCLAGLTLALTLPDRDFAKRLATSINKRTTDAYSDLLFVFSWTAIAHWVSVVSALLLILLWQDQPLIPSDVLPSRRFMVALVTILVAYSFFQFLITLITLSQVGRTYINSLKAGK